MTGVSTFFHQTLLSQRKKVVKYFRIYCVWKNLLISCEMFTTKNVHEFDINLALKYVQLAAVLCRTFSRHIQLI